MSYCFRKNDNIKLFVTNTSNTKSLDIIVLSFHDIIVNDYHGRCY